MAAGNSSCPAFTSQMIDTAAMAMFLPPGAAAITSVGDDPGIPTIFCNIEIASESRAFQLEVNYSQPGDAFVYGWHMREGENDTTQLYSSAEDLTLSQMHACRAAILKSFVWNNYCVPDTGQ